MKTTDANPKDHLEFFKNVSLFRGLTEKQLSSLVEIMNIQEAAASERITTEGAKEDTVFILLKGEVEISKSLVLPLWMENTQKQEKSLIVLNEKMFPFFGEMALLEDEPERSATVSARKASTLAVMEKPDILNVLEKDARTGSIVYKNIGIELTKRLLKANRDILKLTTAFTLALEG